MRLTRRAATLGGLGALATGAFASRAMAIDGPIEDLVEGAEDFRAASDAYVYGYPLVTMEMTRRVLTTVAQVEGTRGPTGQVIKMRAYPDASFRDVTAPNADTLYTTSFFDVGDEPWVLSVPDMKGRYFLLPFLDGWTNVFSVPGSRTTGTQVRPLSLPGRAGRRCSRRSDTTQVPDRHRLASRPHLLHRHAGGLRRGSRPPGRVQAPAAQHLGQGQHAAWRQGRSGDRHEKAGEGPG